MRSKSAETQDIARREKCPRRVFWVLSVVIGLVVFHGFSDVARAADRGYGFAVFGVIDAVSVKPGQAVAAGDVLARLDDRVYRARLNTARSALDLANNAVTLAEKEYDRVKQRYDDLSASGQALEQADVGLRTAKRDRAKAEEAHLRAQWDLDHATLTSPVAGTVKSVSGYRGLLANPAIAAPPVVVITTP
ncbi:efflux RND transporter periplasmic adaptor subunit [Varunaivibrio sulfuroxidans]|nr:biotin/lipoyl-binding protein [Varunaivibrio sulfuroxidans]WES31324.1 biotin/lipoyl-binding protein [Varunaivibrio sulfuroxidans]